jgi:hypothetical protein
MREVSTKEGQTRSCRVLEKRSKGIVLESI